MGKSRRPRSSGAKVWDRRGAGHSQEGEKRLREVPGAEDTGPHNPFRELGVCPRSSGKPLND